MEKKDLIRKIGFYGGNFVIRPIGNLFKEGANLGNPGAAIIYGFVDIFRNASPNFKESKYVRLLEAGGFALYAGKTINNLVNIAKGNFEYLIDLPFDAFMAYEVGRNTFSDYRGKSFKKDVIGVPQDIINIPSNFKEIASSFKTK